ncbi:MAG: efflux RND transporter permease subunit [Calditrichaceae bacterium]|nr:efflux RND transporter permease subunit [Calditrichaceae bacterium]MBN2708318.1 efflux RND transporter permease subunit [Calditrichaceae bacterium]RQV97227.1 MAG: efflux RND transporter permease subunit [Calditrichota bacterium]
MQLPRLAIENHQFSLVIITLLVLTGLVSFITMPRSEDPEVNPPGTSVVIIYPGATPMDMEELIVEPIEEAVNELEDIKDIQSTSVDGLAVLSVEFIAGADAEDKYSDVVQKVNSVRPGLPVEISSIDVEKWSITDVNILELALYSDSAEYHELNDEAEQLKKAMERTPGVKKVQIWAYPEQQVRISIDLDKLAAYKISLNQIIGAIQSSNKNIPGGNLDIGARRFNVQTSGSYKTIEEIGNTVVNTGSGQLVYLKNLADVDFEYEDKEYYTLYKNKKAVIITATQKSGTNIFNVRKSLENKIIEFKKSLPAYIELGTVFDQAVSVDDRMDTFLSNLFQGLILVGLVILIAVGWRPSLIVITAIPVSIFIAIGFIDFTGYGIQQMTIAGLIIALGLLVDNAIVVIENITRYMRTGLNAMNAAVKGTSEIAWAVTSSTATTVLAFIPMIMMFNVTGDFIRSMPVTVIYTLSASLLISLMLTPYLSYKFIKKEQILKTNPVRRKMESLIESHYRKTLSYALKKPKVILLTALSVILLSIILFNFVGISFFPKAEKPQFLINVNTPDGTSLDKTAEVARFVDSTLNQYDEIENFIINIGRGNPRIYYNIMPKRRASNHAQFFIQLREFEPGPFEKLISELRAKFDNYPGAKIEVKELEQGPPFEAPVAIRILGDDLEILKSISIDVENFVKKAYGTVNIDNPLGISKTDLKISINRDKAALLRVPLIETDRTIRAAIAGLPVSKFRNEKGQEYQIVLRLPVKDKLKIEDIDKIYVTSLTGVQVPIRQLASLEFEATPQVITHYNLERSVTVTADVIRGVSVDQATQQIITELDQYNWSKGYRYQISGELESREESFGGMLQAILIAIIGIFGVLVLQFRSLSQPFIVFSAIPLAIIGSILALLITGYSFSFTAFVGFTSLIGIVINNSIILVDYTNQLRKEGKPMLEALQIAGETRFIPIILTTATTVGGLLPLTLRGGTLWAPMGWTIIGGLTVSTVLTLIIVPVLYKLYTPERSGESLNQ